MSVKGDRADQHLAEALTFALANAPCVVACKTSAALVLAERTIRAQGHSVRMVRMQNWREVELEAINAFEGGLVDYLVISTDLLYGRPRQFRRVGCRMVCSTSIVASRATAFRLLLGDGPVEPSRVLTFPYTKGRVNALT
jgi:hypothetical protein